MMLQYFPFVGLFSAPSSFPLTALCFLVTGRVLYCPPFLLSIRSVWFYLFTSVAYSLTLEAVFSTDLETSGNFQTRSYYLLSHVILFLLHFSLFSGNKWGVFRWDGDGFCFTCIGLAQTFCLTAGRLIWSANCCPSVPIVAFLLSVHYLLYCSHTSVRFFFFQA